MATKVKYTPAHYSASDFGFQLESHCKYIHRNQGSVDNKKKRVNDLMLCMEGQIYKVYREFKWRLCHSE